MRTEPEEYCDAARQACLRAAAVVEEWRHRFQVREKGRCDLVTEADLASQRTIFTYLRERFPGHAFLGEEDTEKQTNTAPSPSSSGAAAENAPPTWIVDPIDGTTNFVHDFPFYCISIGLRMGGQLVAGAVYDPNRQEMFHAARGMGAWLGDRRLQVSQVARLQDALLSTGFPTDVRKQENGLKWWHHFAIRAQSLRRTGSTALNLVYVAAGRFDGYWAFDNHVWDVAGAAVILREAGGLITNVDGHDYDPFRPDAVAANALLHPMMMAEFRENASPAYPTR